MIIKDNKEIKSNTNIYIYCRYTTTTKKKQLIVILNIPPQIIAIGKAIIRRSKLIIESTSGSRNTCHSVVVINSKRRLVTIEHKITIDDLVISHRRRRFGPRELLRLLMRLTVPNKPRIDCTRRLVLIAGRGMEWRRRWVDESRRLRLRQRWRRRTTIELTISRC